MVPSKDKINLHGQNCWKCLKCCSLLMIMDGIEWKFVTVNVEISVSIFSSPEPKAHG